MTKSNTTKFNAQYILGLLIFIVMLSLACLATVAYIKAQETIDIENECLREVVAMGLTRADAEIMCNKQ